MGIFGTKTLEEIEREQEQRKDLKRLLLQLEILKDEYADLIVRVDKLERREVDSNAAEEQASPHPLSFKELERKKGFLYRALSGIDYPVICLSDVEQWLKTRGLDNLIGD